MEDLIILPLFFIAVSYGLCWLWQIIADKRRKPRKQQKPNIPPPAIPKPFDDHAYLWDRYLDLDVKRKYLRKKCLRLDSEHKSLSDEYLLLEWERKDLWRGYSRFYRGQKNWRCERCELSLHADQHLLHTHHIYGKTQNASKSLKALCIGCHAQEPGAGHKALKNTSEHDDFMKKYENKWKERLKKRKFL